MEQEQKNGYRQVFKVTSIFGGVQIFNILIGLVRTKFAAILLGTSGIGFMGLLTVPLGFIGGLTSLGIAFSAVRDISAANETNDQVKLSATLKTFRRWIWLTGLLGMFTVLVLSPWLSQWSFGNKNYTWAFILVSVTLLINSISEGQSAILRGTRRIKDISKAGIWGSTLGLFASIPLYYLYGIEGIVPALIISAFTSLYLFWYFSRKVKVLPIQISYKESYIQGKQMVKLGIMMTLTGLIANGASYLMILFIGSKGNMDQVGLYNAGWSITNQYVGLVFASIAVDYFPRLAGIHQDNSKVKKAANQQAEIAILIISPILLFYLLSLPILVPLLYTNEFLAMIPFTQWIVLGMMFKLISWLTGYIVLAKGDVKLFFWTEFIGHVLLLVCNAGGYYFWGLEGIGIGFVLLYIFHSLLMLIICRKKYEFSFTGTFFRMFRFQYVLCLFAFIIVYIYKYPIGYISGSICLCVSAFYSFRELDKRIDIKGFILKLKNR